MTDTKTTIRITQTPEGTEALSKLAIAVGMLAGGLELIDGFNETLEDMADEEAVDPTDEPEVEVAADAPTHDELKAKLRVLLDALIDDAMTFPDTREQLPGLLRAYRAFDYDSPSLFR